MQFSVFRQADAFIPGEFLAELDYIALHTSLEANPTELNEAFSE